MRRRRVNGLSGGSRYDQAGAHFANLRPGHPVYERLRREWIEAEGGSEQEVLESLDRMIDDMRKRRMANTALFAQDDGESEGGA